MKQARARRRAGRRARQPEPKPEPKEESRPTLRLAIEGEVPERPVVFHAMGRERRPGPQGVMVEIVRLVIVAGGIGLILGLVLATLLAFPLYHLPRRAAYAVVGVVYLSFAYLGYKLGRAKSDELFSLFGVKPRAAGTLSDRKSCR